MPRRHSHLPDTGSPYGSIGLNASYQAAMNLYRQDRLQQAYEAMLDIGSGPTAEAIPGFRMIEAEYFSRQASQTFAMDPTTNVECTPYLQNLLPTMIVRAREEVGSRLQIKWDSVVLVTLLVEEVNAPWAPGRHGFCTPKQDFIKICLPHYLTRNEADLEAALRHEFSHAYTYQIAEDTCDTWLNEAIAMQLGGESVGDAIDVFQSGVAEWLDPERLSIAFKKPRTNRKEHEAAWRAYQQAHLIGKHMVENNGEQILGSILKAHLLGFLDRMRASFQGISISEFALSKATNLSVDQLFENCFGNLQS